MGHHFQTINKYAILILVLIMACDYVILFIEGRLLEGPKNKYHHVLSSYDHQGVPQRSIIRGNSVNPHKINHSGEGRTKFGMTSSGSSPGGVGHSIGDRNDEDAEPKQALASGLSSAGATHFMTGFKGGFPAPSPAGN
ncbi:hypothetical protein FNV43_RR17204 [Rhamnella rubrinervis]|uniref:Uncharacterized protein n=1 Tax=Rhamnella rubrinervis TaxID=2594499 RepID=A0A8K0E366_9ROSA|nr:hypothetical protein FNV43_RR17204 [Rhamnella rubrinervis]